MQHVNMRFPRPWDASRQGCQVPSQTEKMVACWPHHGTLPHKAASSQSKGKKGWPASFSVGAWAEIWKAKPTARRSSSFPASVRSVAGNYDPVSDRAAFPISNCTVTDGRRVVFPTCATISSTPNPQRADDPRRSNQQDSSIRYNNCCKGGKISIPPFKPRPEPLASLARFDDDATSRKFIRNIRQYNCLFAFTSMGAQIDNSVNDGRGPPLFKICGQVHHRIGTLLPDNGSPPRSMSQENGLSMAPLKMVPCSTSTWSFRLQDVLGTITEITALKTVHIEGQLSPTIIRDVMIEDLSRKTLKITLWAKRATSFTIQDVYDPTGGETIQLHLPTQPKHALQTFQPPTIEHKTLEQLLTMNPYDYPDTGYECTVTSPK
ncbi:hypothetical protein Zm00014a_037725 [Zea mays]|uniref:Replication protein A OB domain-containing protein n=1 Tax=Zea mays TaxID=4577 RepID=A0A3L6EH62_MAIZE|nr:hypothetical protein Zm00014a_037725 [Zea mays]